MKTRMVGRFVKAKRARGRATQYDVVVAADLASATRTDGMQTWSTGKQESCGALSEQTCSWKTTPSGEENEEKASSLRRAYEDEQNPDGVRRR